MEMYALSYLALLLFIVGYLLGAIEGHRAAELEFLEIARAQSEED